MIGQVWMASDGSLGLVLANPSNETVALAAAVRVDGHTHLKASGRALVDGVSVPVGEKHLETARTMPPLSAAVIQIQKL